jgi:phenylacetate-CoA ligase
MIAITPLDAWIREKAGIAPDLRDFSFAKALRGYQLRKINETIDHARSNAPFYRRRLASAPAGPLTTLSDLAQIPFTFPSELAQDPFAFLAVNQNEIARIVTLRTSGSTGVSKRIFFTQNDLELTVDFFHRGMGTLVKPGQRVAILLPGEMPDSVGDLLLRGLERMDVQSLVYGPVKDPVDAASAIASFGAHCVVGIPTQVLAVALSRTGGATGKGNLESLLLSTDYVPRAVAGTLQKVWGCRVFNHYGMTETGLGGGVECDALDGYHLREADLYFEVVDHETGAPCPDGMPGEVVFTTLTREGMPLIRYRTGDIARFIPAPCPCGTVLRRMERVRGRWEGIHRLGPGALLTLSDMDEALFRLPGLLDYRAIIIEGKDKGFRMHVDVRVREDGCLDDSHILEALYEVDAIRAALRTSLETPTLRLSSEECWTTTGVSKRKLLVSPSSAVSV